MVTLETVKPLADAAMSGYKRLRLEYAKRGIYNCTDCGEILNLKEVMAARKNKLNMLDVCCDKCWTLWSKEKYEETRHPDER